MTGGTPMTSWNPPDETAGFTHFPIFPSRFLRPFCEAFCENIRKEDPQSVWRPPEGAKMGQMGGFWRMEDPSIHGKSINGGFPEEIGKFSSHSNMTLFSVGQFLGGSTNGGVLVS